MCVDEQVRAGQVSNKVITGTICLQTNEDVLAWSF